LVALTIAGKESNVAIPPVPPHAARNIRLNLDCCLNREEVIRKNELLARTTVTIRHSKISITPIKALHDSRNAHPIRRIIAYLTQFILVPSLVVTSMTFTHINISGTTCIVI